jgi:succinoglycan biosynthesis protein ExoA
VAAPLVSIIVPCRNEARRLARCLESILDSDYPRESMEVIVADGRSQDSSRAVAEAIAAPNGCVRVIDNPGQITPAGLNRAIQAARGEYILRVDAHSTISRNYIGAVVGCLRESGAWAAGGGMRTVTEGRGAMSRAIGAALSHPFGVGNSAFRTAGAKARGPRQTDALFNACWPREAFVRLGGFDERLRRSQDIEFSARLRRAGRRMLLLPEAESRYYLSGRFGDFARQSWTNGVWAVLPGMYLGRLPLGARHLAPLAFAGVLLAGVVAAAAAPALAWWPASLLLLYSAAAWCAALHAALRFRDAALALALPPVFATLHFAYGAGSLWGGLRVVAVRLARREPGAPSDHTPAAGETAR